MSLLKIPAIRYRSLRKELLSFSLFFSINLASFSQNITNFSLHDKNGLELFLDSIFNREMEKSKIPGSVISIVKDGKVLFSKGYGHSDLESKKPVDPAKTIFRIGSITKVFTAAAVLQLAGNKRIAMEDDVNKYLSDVKIPGNFSKQVTFSHLLTHSAGFDEISRGRVVDAESKLVPLGSFLKDRIVRIRPAGEISSYNTYGISLAGFVVEKISGLSLKDYFQKNIFAPLKMNSSNLGTLPGHLKPHLATGYIYSKDAGYKPLNFVWFNTYPASDINSTASDMSNFMIALLEGKYDKGRILSEKMQKKMMTPQHRNHPGIPGWAYGLQEARKINGQIGFEHGGNMDDGYSSLMYLMPEQKIGIFMASSKESTNIYDVVKEAFVKRYFPLKEKPVVATPTAELKKDLQRFEGKYRWDPYCHSCGDSARAQSVTIASTKEGMLSFWSGKWVQVKPLLFQLADGVLAGQVYVAFKENEKGRITFFFLGGPFAYERAD